MISRFRPLLRLRRERFAAQWGFAPSTVSNVLNGKAPISHEMLAALRTVADDQVLPSNRDVRRYLDGVLSDVDETLTLLRPDQRAHGQRMPQYSMRQREVMNALADVTVSLDPEPVETQERRRMIEAAVLPSLVTSAAQVAVPLDRGVGYSADVSVTVEDHAFAFGDVVDGELIGNVGVRPDWLTRVGDPGWAVVGGHIVLDVTSWDNSGRPTAIRTVVFDTQEPLPWFGEDELTADDRPETRFALATAHVGWSGEGLATVTVR